MKVDALDSCNEYQESIAKKDSISDLTLKFKKIIDSAVGRFINLLGDQISCIFRG